MRWLTTLCYAAMTSLSIGLNLLPVFLTTLSSLYGGAAGLSNEQLGRLGAAAFLGLVVGIALTGPLADRAGLKRFAIAGNALVAISLVGVAFAPSYPWLLAGLFLLGLGAGILDMVLSPIVAALHPRDRSAAMNWLHSFYSVGAVVTILAGLISLQTGLGWKACALGLAVFPTILAGLMVPLRFPSLSEPGQRRPLRSLLAATWFRLALAAIFLGGATELGMAQWLPAYAERSLGFPAWMGGLSLLLFSLAMALGRMVVGAVGATWNPFSVMTWSCASTVVLFLGSSFLPYPTAALACAIAAGFTGSCLWPTLLAVAADRYPEGGASLFGILAAFGNAGGIFMPWLVGVVADRSSLHWGLAISAVAPALMLPLLRHLRR